MFSNPQKKIANFSPLLQQEHPFLFFQESLFIFKYHVIITQKGRTLKARPYLILIILFLQVRINFIPF